jgi:hypothetical protein
LLISSAGGAHKCPRRMQRSEHAWTNGRHNPLIENRMTEVLTKEQIENRAHWRNVIIRLSGDFGVDAEKVEENLSEETQKKGLDSLLGHLRLCGAIPEEYQHDSSEEKLYSKYTDVVIHETFKAIGLTSLVLKTRADVADVECVAEEYSFVADAKAFRLSRTAKNQKDFKVQAMDGWKHGKPYAMVVCPVYQLPSRTSQIYAQAGSRSVCIGTYSHLSVLARFAASLGADRSIDLLHEIFKAVESLAPSKAAASYWHAINRTMLDFDDSIAVFWRDEKIAAVESVDVLRKEALEYYAKERERIMRLSKEDAIAEVLKQSKIKTRTEAIKRVSDNGIMQTAYE